MENNTWKVDIEVWDTYDFTTLLIKDEGFTKKTLANDLGFVMQHTFLLIPYDWDVNYSMLYTEE